MYKKSMFDHHINELQPRFNSKVFHIHRWFLHRSYRPTSISRIPREWRKHFEVSVVQKENSDVFQIHILLTIVLLVKSKILCHSLCMTFLPICKSTKKCLAVECLPKMTCFCSFLLFKNHFLKTTFDFATISGKTKGKVSNENENHFVIAEFSR